MHKVAPPKIRPHRCRSAEKYLGLMAGRAARRLTERYPGASSVRLAFSRLFIMSNEQNTPVGQHAPDLQNAQRCRPGLRLAKEAPLLAVKRLLKVRNRALHGSFCALLLGLAGCSRTTAGTWMSGDLAPFVLRCATTLGANPRTNHIPRLECKWAFTTMPARFAEAGSVWDTILVAGDHFKDLQGFLKQAFGNPDPALGSHFVSAAEGSYAREVTYSVKQIGVWLTCGLLIIRTPGSSSTNTVIYLSGWAKPPWFDAKEPLVDRIRPGVPALAPVYNERRPAAHILTAHERTVVEDAFRQLPPLHRRVLMEHLLAIYFLESPPVTGQTLPADIKEPHQFFDFIFNAAALKLTASEWLTQKERTCFRPDKSGYSVRVDCGTNLPAFVYILLHEATHVVDFCKGITPGEALQNTPAPTSFTRGIWEQFSLPVPKYCYPLRKQVGFYDNGHKVPLADAEALYSSLSRTPFVSLYGGSNWMEDLAECLAVYHVTRVLHQPYRIVVLKDGHEVMTVEPMASPLVKERMGQMRQFYER